MRNVHNPLLDLPAAVAIRALPDPARSLLRGLLIDLANDAGARAQHCWRKHKAPMALYWKCVSVYARHIARVLGRAS